MRTGLVSAVVLMIAAGCGDEGEGVATPARETPAPTTMTAVEYLPRITDAHLPPLLTGLVPGTATAEDVLARFPDLETDRDHSLGGTMAVAYNAHPAVVLRLAYSVKDGPRGRPDGLEDLRLYLVPDEAGVPRVWSMTRVLDPRGGPTLCAWLHEAVGQDAQALVCPGTNRRRGRVGKSPDAGTYCVGTPYGTRGILVECRTTSKGYGEIEYDLMGPPATG